MMTVKEITKENATTPLRKAFLRAKESAEMKRLLKERFKAVEEDLKKALESEVKENA
jgi:hypothetical protein